GGGGVSRRRRARPGRAPRTLPPPPPPRLRSRPETESRVAVNPAEQIVDWLREAAAPLSGQELARRLGCTRAAVWKHIAALRQAGYEIPGPPPPPLLPPPRPRPPPPPPPPP